MSTSRLAAYLLSVSAAVAVFAGCNSGSPSSGLAPTAGANAAVSGLQRFGHDSGPPVIAVRAARLRPDHHTSWVSPDVKRAPRLLFISDYGAGDVDIFTMPALALKGTLTGFSSPEGECSDAGGNIWIANTGASEMQQYSRTGTLLKTLSVSNEYPAGCAVNANNDLAVSNIINTSGGAGNITVFTNGSGSGTVYTNSSIYEYFFVGYDPSGNLYFDGTDSSRTTSYFAELPAGSSSTKTITLSGGTLHFAGFVQWYNAGGYVALGDQQCGGTAAACVYWVSVAGSTGTITGTTNLSNYAGGAVCALAQGVIAGNGEKYVAGGDYESCGNTATTVNRWPYEAGGTPTNYNNSTSFVEPIGAAISTK